MNKYIKKRYTLIDNKTKTVYNYSKVEWNLAFVAILILGIAIGIHFGIILF